MLQSLLRIQLYTGKIPFSALGDRQVALSVIKGARPPRPVLSNGKMMADPLWLVTTSCWVQNWSERPAAKLITERIKATVLKTPSPPAVDNKIVRMENVKKPVVIKSRSNRAPNRIKASTLASSLQQSSTFPKSEAATINTVYQNTDRLADIAEVDDMITDDTSPHITASRPIPLAEWSAAFGAPRDFNKVVASSAEVTWLELLDREDASSVATSSHTVRTVTSAFRAKVLYSCKR